MHRPPPLRCPAHWPTATMPRPERAVGNQDATPSTYGLASFRDPVLPACHPRLEWLLDYRRRVSRDSSNFCWPSAQGRLYYIASSPRRTSDRFGPKLVEPAGSAGLVPAPGTDPTRLGRPRSQQSPSFRWTARCGVGGTDRHRPRRPPVPPFKERIPLCAPHLLPCASASPASTNHPAMPARRRAHSAAVGSAVKTSGVAPSALPSPWQSPCWRDSTRFAGGSIGGASETVWPPDGGARHFGSLIGIKPR
jgi:hypothetical protein